MTNNYIPMIEARGGTYREVGKQIGGSFVMMGTPLADIHLHSHLAYDQPVGNIAYIYIFAAVAFFILMIACINYMNMATARSAGRAGGDDAGGGAGGGRSQPSRNGSPTHRARAVA